MRRTSRNGILHFSLAEREAELHIAFHLRGREAVFQTTSCLDQILRCMGVKNDLWYV